MPETIGSVYGLPSTEQFSPVWVRRSPEVHFDPAPPTACSGSTALAEAGTANIRKSSAMPTLRLMTAADDAKLRRTMLRLYPNGTAPAKPAGYRLR
jgi:hypothetical protein